jgi:hypothetical protein
MVCPCCVQSCCCINGAMTGGYPTQSLCEEAGGSWFTGSRCTTPISSSFTVIAEWCGATATWTGNPTTSRAEVFDDYTARARVGIASVVGSNHCNCLRVAVTIQTFVVNCTLRTWTGFLFGLCDGDLSNPVSTGGGGCDPEEPPDPLPFGVNFFYECEDEVPVVTVTFAP